jgi:Na+/H+ antiporter NhaD/arsenite permease-like protein
MPPYWTVLPFVFMLLSIAIIPLAKPHWWESNTHKGYVSLVLGGFVLLYLLFVAPHEGHEKLYVTLLDYIAFIALLGSLFIISGGIYIRGSMSGTPVVNTVVLLIGAVLASFMGTTGAAMLLVRPIMRANAWRKSQVHVIIFLIFLVANIGGLLTPLGDPPLYLGFLKGVPFQWTLGLYKEWVIAVGLCLVAFYVMDTMKYRTEINEGRRPPEDKNESFGIEGGLNFVWLVLIIAIIFASGMVSKLPAVCDMMQSSPHSAEALLKIGQAVLMLVVAGLSLRMTSREVRGRNDFNYTPIVEVAVLFIGIFITMIPALWILDELGRAGRLGIDQPWHFFWVAGGLSSFLDNAPTYLTFSSAASGLHNLYQTAAGDKIATDPNNLMLLLQSTGLCVREGVQMQLALGEKFLQAIACGSVFMGANTYIGNGPNFMVKTIAEQGGVQMPSFFGYMVYSVLILVPIFIILTFIFF